MNIPYNTTQRKNFNIIFSFGMERFFHIESIFKCAYFKKWKTQRIGAH